MSAYRQVDPKARRESAIREARRIRDALDSSRTFHNIADGNIGSSREIADALTNCINELEQT